MLSYLLLINLYKKLSLLFFFIYQKMYSEIDLLISEL